MWMNDGINIRVLFANARGIRVKKKERNEMVCKGIGEGRIEHIFKKIRVANYDDKMIAE